MKLLAYNPSDPRSLAMHWIGLWQLLRDKHANMAVSFIHQRSGRRDAKVRRKYLQNAEKHAAISERAWCRMICAIERHAALMDAGDHCAQDRSERK